MDNQKVILITGCSSGFGLLSAVRLAHSGHLVWATMRDLSKKGDLEQALAAQGAQATIRALDVTKPATIKNVLDEICQRHHHIDVLVNNAGFGTSGFFEDMEDSEIRAQMETNFFGVQNVCREVIPRMRERRSGKIINVSSIAGLVATPTLSAYCSSKWALEAFSECLYHELGFFGISVVILEPGPYQTKIFSDNARYAKRFDDPQSPYFKMNQSIKNGIGKRVTKLRKDPKDVARLIEHIIDDPKPRLRYASDFSSWSRVMLQKYLPPSIATKIFRRFVHANS